MDFNAQCLGSITMAKFVNLFYMGTIIPRRPKKSLRTTQLLVLVCVLAYFVFIYSSYPKRLHTEKKREHVELQVIKTAHHRNVVHQSPVTYLHHPKPKTFSKFTRNHVHLFVIMSMQRSGSGWFETLLNSHMNISSNGEILDPKSRRENISSIINMLDRVYSLNWITNSSKKGATAIGFKWMLNQGLMEHPKEILNYFTKRGVSVIFFFRRNMLRRLVSILANSFDKYAKLLDGIHVAHVHSHKEALTLSRYKPTINVASLKSELGEMEATAMKALEYFNSTRHIIVYYEDLIKNPHNKLIQVEDFLKLPRKKLKSRHVKIHKGPLSKYIDNWEDVKMSLNGTTYERYLRNDY